METIWPSAFFLLVLCLGLIPVRETQHSTTRLLQVRSPLKIQTNPSYPQYGKATEFSEGLASVCTGDCSEFGTRPSNLGYIDRDEKLVIPMQFGIAASFSKGLAEVCIGTCRWKEKDYSGKFGFMGHSGHFVINPQYDNAWDVTNGFAKVSVGKGASIQ